MFGFYLLCSSQAVVGHRDIAANGHTHKQTHFIYLYHISPLGSEHNKQKAVRETNSETLLLVTTNGEGREGRGEILGK